MGSSARAQPIRAAQLRCVRIRPAERIGGFCFGSSAFRYRRFARSEKIGEVTGTNRYGRTGEHRRDGFCVFAGPGIESGAFDSGVSLLDLAPTLSALLGVEMQDHDGRVLSDVCPQEGR